MNKTMGTFNRLLSVERYAVSSVKATMEGRSLEVSQRNLLKNLRELGRSGDLSGRDVQAAWHVFTCRMGRLKNGEDKICSNLQIRNIHSVIPAQAGISIGSIYHSVYY